MSGENLTKWLNKSMQKLCNKCGFIHMLHPITAVLSHVTNGTLHSRLIWFRLKIRPFPQIYASLRQGGGEHSPFTGVPRKDANLIGSSDVNLALINGYSLSKSSFMVNLNMNTSFIGVGAFGGEI